MLDDLQNRIVGEDDNDSRNIIGKDTFVYGDLETKGNIRIDGKMEGNIKSALKIVLGRTAVMQGDVVANEIEVDGKLEGSIKAKEKLLLSSNSTVEGDIHSKILKVEAGASLNSKCFVSKALEMPEKRDQDKEKAAL